MALPSLPKPPAREMAGPTPFSNWVIPGRVLAGAYPASLDDLETQRVLTLLLELGVNTFVCLQAEVNMHIPDHVWRAGSGLRPYIRDAQRLLSKAQEAGSTRIPQRKLDFLHLPIIDGSVTADTAMSRLADDCCERVLKGERLYIHCWGGHGRTGTLVATMLGRLYGLPFSSAMRHTQAYHDTRLYPQGVRSPQTAVQRAQVRRLLLLPSAWMNAAQHTTATGSSASNSLVPKGNSSRSAPGSSAGLAVAGTLHTPMNQQPAVIARPRSVDRASSAGGGSTRLSPTRPVTNSSCSSNNTILSQCSSGNHHNQTTLQSQLPLSLLTKAATGKQAAAAGAAVCLLPAAGYASNSSASAGVKCSSVQQIQLRNTVLETTLGTADATKGLLGRRSNSELSSSASVQARFPSRSSVASRNSSKSSLLSQ